MLDEGARMFPISEAVRIVKGISANHRDEGEEEQSNHQEYLEDGHVKFGDAKVTHCDRVQEGIENDHRHDDSLDRYLVRPESNHDVDCYNFKRHQNCHVQEEVPCHGEADGAIHPFAAEANEWRGHRKVARHLTEALVDSPHYPCPDGESDEEPGRTTFGERRTHLNVES